jgi:hypothetical protein
MRTMRLEFVTPFARVALLTTSVIGWCGQAAAYESESGVPLSISAEMAKVAINSVAIRLQGRDVAIVTGLQNRRTAPQTVAFYAATPLFNQLGTGEKYADKSFADLSVKVNGKAHAMTTLRRGYFLGRDITDTLRQTGLSPLPDLNADPRKLRRLPTIYGIKPDMWQGAVVHTWVDTIAPQTEVVHEVHYRALPQFDMQELASESLAQSIRQHCGDPDAVRQHVIAAVRGAEYVMVERYEIRVPFAAYANLTIDVSQPPRNWLGVKPVVVLACGASGQGTQLHGEIESAGQTLDVLVISNLNSGAADGDHLQ